MAVHSLLPFQELNKIESNLFSDQTPLHIAASVSNCRATAMALLMHPDIDPEIKNNCNELAIDLAKRTGLSFPVFNMGHPAYRHKMGIID